MTAADIRKHAFVKLQDCHIMIAYIIIINYLLLSSNQEIRN